MRKDIETAAMMASEAGTPARLLALLRSEWAEAVAALGPRADNTEIHRHLAQGRPE
jgi:3-hydroxyisobutyrate dehydrogenase-like beta-hydroxyacid dehydrogenase